MGSTLGCLVSVLRGHQYISETRTLKKVSAKCNSPSYPQIKSRKTISTNDSIILAVVVLLTFFIQSWWDSATSIVLLLLSFFSATFIVRLHLLLRTEVGVWNLRGVATLILWIRDATIIHLRRDGSVNDSSSMGIARYFIRSGTLTTLYR